jgi:ribosomal protein S18 acetylase RimI-like enzyme
MREVFDPDEVAALCGPDPLCRWAATAAGRPAAPRVFASPAHDAVAVAAPDLSGRDRIAVRGTPQAAGRLVRAVLDVVGPGYRPLGDRELLRRVAAGTPGLRLIDDFGWMECRRAPEPTAAGAVAWLARDRATDREVEALLGLAFPGSYARARYPEDVRWAGTRDGGGALRAVAALAWSAPGIGFLAGVAVHPVARGRGLARLVCGFAAADAVARHGAVGLIVDDENAPALRCYRSIGFGYRPLAAAVAAAD